MDWRFPLLTAAIAGSALFAPSLFAQDTGTAPATPSAQAAPADKEAQPGKEAPPPGEKEKKEDEGKRANDQVVVIGYGFGQHLFATKHHTRQTTGELVITSTLVEQFYGEWYVLDRVGVGVRFLSFGEKVTSSATVGFGGTSTTVSDVLEVKVHTILATVHWVPLGGRRYGRIGFLAGLGTTTYDLSETTSPGGTDSFSTSGTATLAGGYVDWGADGFGARFGIQYLATDLAPINGDSVDVSGRETYLDFRWAF